MSDINDILTQIKADAEAETSSLTAVIRKRPRKLAADEYPLLVISYRSVEDDELLGADTGKLVRYTVEILYLISDNTVSIDDTVEDNVKILRKLYYGYADLVVAGVAIEDVNYIGDSRKITALSKKGIQHILIEYEVTVKEPV